MNRRQRKKFNKKLRHKNYKNIEIVMLNMMHEWLEIFNKTDFYSKWEQLKDEV